MLVDIAAVIGSFNLEITSFEGFTSHIKAHDFLISAESLVSLGEPAPYDLIAFGGETYEVLDLPSEPAWRFSDEFNTTYRIHTKKIS